MTRLLIALTVLLAIGGPLAAGAWAAPKLLRNTDLVPLTTPGQAIGGVQPGLASWVIDNGTKAKVDADGGVKVVIHGLVFAATGTTTSPGGSVVSSVQASVVCGNVVAGTTAPVPISSSGDAIIRDQVALPDGCADPVVLVRIATPTGPGRWIAEAGL